jgi:hypothetical protein
MKGHAFMLSLLAAKTEVAKIMVQNCSVRRIATLILCLVASPAFAQLSSDAPAFYTSADIVFTGVLDKISASPTGLTAQFRVERLIKGGLEANKILRAQLPSESRCHKFEERHSYLIYGRAIGGTVWVNPCEGSKLVSQAEDDLRYIHTINPRVSERCSRNRLSQLAARSPIIAMAEVIGTEDSMGTNATLLFRPWCGLVLSTEDAYYSIREVLKGQIPDSKVVVEHAICWDTVTVDGYYPNLSPELFREGNVLLLFLKAGSHQSDRHLNPPFSSIYEDLDENCGAVMADGEAAQRVIENVRAHRER